MDYDRRPLTRAFVRFRSDDRGGIAMIFGLLTVVLMGFVGGAVDTARYYHLKALYRDAVDSASLAAARIKQTGGTDADAFAVADAYMQALKAKHPVGGNVEFKIADSGLAIEASGKLWMQTLILSVIQIKEMEFNVGSTAKYGIGPDIELALMLDITGSMNGQKIADLKAAVDDMINIVIQTDGDASKSRIALAPFSNAVRLNSKQFKAATGILGGGYKRCVVERPGGDAYTDASPTAGGYLAALEDVAPGAHCKDDSEIFPLSNKKSDLKHKVNSLEAGGMTAGHLGSAWAWYLLSPEWNELFEDSEKPAPYSVLSEKNPNGGPKLRKIAILMTDGEYNTQYLGADSTTQARAICTEMKKTGIEVFTVGFQLGGSPTVIQTLQNCASSPSNFYDAGDGSGLRQAFRDIALKASPLRLTQ